MKDICQLLQTKVTEEGGRKLEFSRNDDPADNRENTRIIESGKVKVTNKI
jgi:hypothetical protein